MDFGAHSPRISCCRCCCLFFYYSWKKKPCTKTQLQNFYFIAELWGRRNESLSAISVSLLLFPFLFCSSIRFLNFLDMHSTCVKHLSIPIECIIKCDKTCFNVCIVCIPTKKNASNYRPKERKTEKINIFRFGFPRTLRLHHILGYNL